MGYRVVSGIFILAFLLVACEMPLTMGEGGSLLLIGEPSSVPVSSTSLPPIEITVTATSQPPEITEAIPTETLSEPPVQPTQTPKPSFTPTPTTLPYQVQPGSPAAIPSFSHRELGCNWMGIAGQVFGASGEPELSILVEVGGVLGNSPFNSFGVTGSAPVFGPGGYEITLGDHPLETQDMLFIQLFDLQGNRLSEPVLFDTYGECSRNLILINFTRIFLPIDYSYMPFVKGK